MFELLMSTGHGWLAIHCTCAAGRAVFPTEEAANAALASHLKACGAPAGTQFRTAAVEPLSV